MTRLISPKHGLRVLSLALALCLGFALSSCQQDSPRSSTQQPTQALTPILLGDMELELQYPEALILNNTDTEDETQKPRSLTLTAPDASSKYPKLGLKLPNGQSQEDFYVFALLRNPQNSNQVYYSSKPLRWILRKDGDKIKVRIKGEDTFVGFISLTGGGNLTNAVLAAQENWRLEAIYVPGLANLSDAQNYNSSLWNKNTKQLRIQGIMPKRFYAAGEELELGKDINIPFILKSLDARGNKTVGLPLKRKATSQERVNEILDNDAGARLYYNIGQLHDIYTLAQDPGQRISAQFEPAGSLYCLRFHNRMNSPNGANTLIGGEYWNTLNMQHQHNYNYRINGVSVSSGLSSTSGYYDFSSISPVGQLPKWGAAIQTSYEDGVRFAEANKVSFDVGSSTGWYYIWMHELPTPRGEQRTNFFLNLYNKSLDMEMQSFRAFSTRTAQGQQYQEGKRYYREVNLNEELRPIPLMLMGQDYIAFNRQGAMWADSLAYNSKHPQSLTALNDNPGAGSLYTYEQFREFVTGQTTGGDPRFTVAKASHRGDGSIFSKLDWLIPDLATVYSVFPTKLPGINHGADYTEGDFASTTDNVRIEGRPYNNTRSVYYRRNKDWVNNSEWSLHDNSVSIYYGLRFIGTPYASVYRYIYKGKWRNRGGESASTPSDNARLVIQSKRVSRNVGMVNGSYNEAAARDYLSNIVAHQTDGSFWSPSGKPYDWEEVNPNVVTRVLHVPGSPSGSNNTHVGRSMTLWIYNDPSIRKPNILNNRGKINYFRITGVSVALESRQNYETVPLTGQTYDGTPIGIIPFLAPQQRHLTAP